MASGHADRAAALVGEQLDRLPDDAPSAWFARMLAVRADRAVVIETDEDPADVSAEALALVPDDAAGLRAKVLGIHARSLAVDGPLRGGAGGRARRARAGREARPQRAGLRRDHHAERAEEGRAQGGAAGRPRRRGRAGRGAGALEAELRGRYLLGRSYEDWAEFDEAERWFRSAIDRGRGVRRPVGAVRLRVPLAARLGAARPGRLGRGARALRRARPGAAADPAGAAGEPAADHRVRPRGRRVRGARRAAPLLAARGRHRHPRRRRRDRARPGAAATRRACWRRTTTRCRC